MLRIDRSVTPTMAKAPTLATWELDDLRTHRERRPAGPHPAGGPRPDHVRRGIGADRGGRARRALRGVRSAEPPAGPDLAPERRSRCSRSAAGFPCFGAALAGYVEATRADDEEKNRLCPPSRYGNTLADWAAMNVRGTRASMSFGAEPDIKAWSDGVALNPARVPPDDAGSAELTDALERLRAHARPGLARLAELGRVDDLRR